MQATNIKEVEYHLLLAASYIELLLQCLEIRTIAPRIYNYSFYGSNLVFIHSPTLGQSSLCALDPIQAPTCPELNSKTDLSELPMTSFKALLEAGATRSSFDAITFRNG